MKFVINQRELSKLKNSISLAVEKAWNDYKWILQSEYENNSFDLWELRDSVKVRMVDRYTARVSVDKIQGFVDEFGRRPWWRMPPPDALKWWASRKLWNADLAYAVAKSIQKKGIRAKRTFSRTWESNKKNIYDKISQYIWTTI